MLASSAAVVKPEDGVTFYRMLARDYPANPLADDALFYAADLLARAGQTEEALLSSPSWPRTTRKATSGPRRSFAAPGLRDRARAFPTP